MLIFQPKRCHFLEILDGLVDRINILVIRHPRFFIFRRVMMRTKLLKKSADSAQVLTIYYRVFMPKEAAAGETPSAQRAVIDPLQLRKRLLAQLLSSLILLQHSITAPFFSSWQKYDKLRSSLRREVVTVTPYSNSSLGYGISPKKAVNWAKKSCFCSPLSEC